MDAYQQGLRELLQKGRLSPLDVKEGMIAAYIFVTRLNQTQGAPGVGLQQKPEGLYGHLKGFMGAIFWERGYDFDNPSLEQLAEVKIMTDGMAQIYAMPENLQNILNNLVDYLLAKGRGTAASLEPEVSSMFGITGESTPSEPPEKELMPWEEPDAPLEAPQPEQENAPAEAPAETPSETAADTAAETPAWELPEPAPEQPAEAGVPESEPIAAWSEEPPAAAETESGAGAAPAEPAITDAFTWEAAPPAEPGEPTGAPEPAEGAGAVFPWETEAAPESAPNEAAAETPAEMPGEAPAETPNEAPFLTETSPASAWGEEESALISETDLPGAPQPEAKFAAADLSQGWNFDVLTNEPAPAAEGAEGAESTEGAEGTESTESEAAPELAAPVKRPRGRPRKNPLPQIVPLAGESAEQPKKRRGRKPKLVLPEGMEQPKPRQRRKPRQKELKIDLAAVQVPDDFMTDDGHLESAEAASLPGAEMETESQPEIQPQPGTETFSDEQLLTDITSQWQPEPVLDQPETAAAEPAWGLSSEPEPEPAAPEMTSWDSALSAEPTQVYGSTDDVATAAELSAEPEAQAAEPEVQAAEPEAETPAGTEEPMEASPSSWRELGGTEMEPENIATSFSQPGSEEPERETVAAEPPRKRGGGIAGFMLLVLGLIIGAGGAYYWFGVRENQTLQTQLAEAKKNATAAQQQLTQAQEQAKNLSAVLNAQREASKRPLAKLKYFKVGKGVVLYWTETDVVRTYNLYYAKGSANEWTKVNEEPLKENVAQFKDVAKGVRRYVVAAIDQDGQETARSEELKLTFPLK